MTPKLQRCNALEPQYQEKWMWSVIMSPDHRLRCISVSVWQGVTYMNNGAIMEDEKTIRGAWSECWIGSGMGKFNTHIIQF